MLDDEFEVRLDDDSEVRPEDKEEVRCARQIMSIRKEICEGNTAKVDELQAKYQARQGKEVATGTVYVREGNQDAEWDSADEESGEDEDGDVDMDDAPALVAAKPKPKPEPEVDEDGFTMVPSKKKR